MKKNLLTTALASVMAVTLLVGCGTSNKGSASGEGDVIKIGGIGPLTGDASTYGISVKEGALLLEKEINEAGGIDGKKIQFLFEDDQADPNSALQAFNKLVDSEKVSAILGGVTSGSTLAIAPNATSREIPMLTPTGTEPTITEVGGEYTFRGCFIDSFQGDTLGSYVSDTLNAKTAAVLYCSGSDYSIGIAKSFKEKFESVGGSVTEYLTYNEGDNDFKAQLTKIKSSNPDVLILPDYYNVVGLITKQARSMGITSQFVGGDGWESEDLVKIGGESIDGAIYMTHYYAEDETEVIKNFVSAYKAEYNKTPDCFAALAYDSARILVEAIDRADSTDSKAIKEALKETNVDNVTGKISFDENRNAVKGGTIIKIQGDSKILADKITP